jgi:hypothetical protein
MKDKNIITGTAPGVSLELSKDMERDQVVTVNNPKSSLMKIVLENKEYQNKLKDIILIEKYFFLEGEAAFVDLKTKEFEIETIPIKNRVNYTIFCSFYFKITEDSKYSTTTDHKGNKQKIIDPNQEILVKTITSSLTDQD